MEEPLPEQPHKHLELADRWHSLLAIHQRMLDQEVSDQAREWMADHLMVLALNEDIERAHARGDTDIAAELMVAVQPYLQRANESVGRYITVRPGPEDHPEQDP
ncbi:hypothetical protein [Herbihabitans rhizosphaerae]|uniref:hypothetical protein n=1 Tax=Herbihabitans rhizosphaerae TaxID=1872711 RepID=UPI00102AE502|nr:hypothetical protein [Herbihabitans rhizosphaerae]